MDEPAPLVRWVIYFFAGGDAGLVAGVSLAAIAFLGLLSVRRRMRNSKLLFVWLVSSLLILACGAVPVPRWFQVVTAVWFFALMWGTWIRPRKQKPVQTNLEGDSPAVSVPQVKKWIWWAGLLSSFLWLITAIVLEMPCHFWMAPAEQFSQVLVIGDSVTAGLNDGEETWPLLLSRERQLRVVDASQPGATIASARQQNATFADRTGLVIIEIGGNDMLEGLPVDRFEADLDRLLNDVCQAGRTVVLFELPLPPFHEAYGCAQRRQARRHQVTLIPKRQFAAVLTTSGATVDGIHLSKSGQTGMKSLILSLFEDRMPVGVGLYQRMERKSVQTTSSL